MATWTPTAAPRAAPNAAPIGHRRSSNIATTSMNNARAGPAINIPEDISTACLPLPRHVTGISSALETIGKVVSSPPTRSPPTFDAMTVDSTSVNANITRAPRADPARSSDRLVIRPYTAPSTIAPASTSTPSAVDTGVACTNTAPPSHAIRLAHTFPVPAHRLLAMPPPNLYTQMNAAHPRTPTAALRPAFAPNAAPCSRVMRSNAGAPTIGKLEIQPARVEPIRCSAQSNAATRSGTDTMTSTTVGDMT